MNDEPHLSDWPARMVPVRSGHVERVSALPRVAFMLSLLVGLSIVGRFSPWRRPRVLPLLTGGASRAQVWMVVVSGLEIMVEFFMFSEAVTGVDLVPGLLLKNLVIEE